MTPRPGIPARKLAPPGPPRCRLARAVVAADGAPVVVLAAGPGWGKTEALRACAEAHAGPVAWVALDEDDGATGPFHALLLAALRPHIPGFGAELEAALPQAEALGPRRLAGRLLDELAAYDPPALLLVLDGLHHLADAQPEAGRAFVATLERLPPGVRVAIATRRRAPAGLARLVATGRAQVLGPDALRFSEADVARYLDLRAGGSAPAAWTQAAARLDGWPLGLELVTAVPPEVGAVLSADDLLGEVVRDEILAARPATERSFALRVALLDEPTTEAVAVALGPPPAGAPEGPGADVAASLAALEEAGLLRAVGPRWTMAPFLADHLRAVARRDVPAEERRAILGRAAAHATAEGRPDNALACWLAAEAWDEALATCDQAFQLARWAGRPGRIDAALAAFPAALRAEAPVLQLWTGHRRAAQGDPLGATGAYEAARRLSEGRGDRAGAFRALVRLATLAQRGAAHERFAPLMRAAQALADHGSAEDRADFLLLRALAADLRGDLALVEACNAAVVALPADDDPEIAMSHVIALMNLYTLALNRGDLARARRWNEQASAIAERHGFSPSARFCGFLRANLDLLEDRLDAAGAFFRDLPAGWADTLDWHERACAWTLLGAYEVARGEAEAAEAALERALRGFEAAGFEDGRKLPLEQLAWLAIARGHAARVPTLLAQAGPIDHRHVYDLALRLPEARALQLAGEPDAAVAAFARLIPALETLGARLLLARARLYQAAALAAAGDAAGAHAALAAGQVAAREGPYPFLATRDRVLQAELAALAARRAAGASAAEGPRTASGGPAGPPPADAGPRVALRLLGPFEARVGGTLVDDWPRRKAKLIVAALALLRRGLEGPQLADLFDDPAFTGNSLQVTLSSLRRTLEPGLGRREESRFLRLLGDRYVLRWEHVDLDLAAFDAERDAAEALRTRDPEAAAARYEAVLGHYRGALLDEPLFAPFFEAERETYRRQAREAALWLAMHHQAARRHAAAEAVLRRAIAVAPADEAPYLALMRLLTAQGQRERALQAYWDCRKALKARLGITPGADLEALHRTVAGG